MDWPLGPGIPWPEIKGPGLKPYRFGHGFRGMNAPAPSEGTNNGKGNHLFCREFVENIKMRRPSSPGCLPCSTNLNFVVAVIDGDDGRAK
jgi:hypothetical protein